MDQTPKQAARQRKKLLGSVHRVAKQIHSSAKRESAHRQQILRQTAHFEGSLDSVEDSVVTGWAWDQQHPNICLTVAVYGDDQLLGTALADRFRPDLASAGIGDGNHAFVFRIPGKLSEGKMHSIEARCAGTDFLLHGSPVRLTVLKGKS
jgi:hypothetical protein